jgi:REP element-mobilizing transposase RayT
MTEYRRRLPHFQPDDAYIFLTWRLWGSVPAAKGRRIACPTKTLTPGRAFVVMDRALDRASTGPRWLRDPRIANLVAHAIRAGETEKRFYELSSWVVMPNHVHMLILPKVDVPVIMRWLKGSTARRANQLLERTGQPFWRDESYDHWVRHRKQLDRITEYIEDNPVSVGLAVSTGEWEWSSASRAGESPAPPRTPETPNV